MSWRRQLTATNLRNKKMNDLATYYWEQIKPGYLWLTNTEYLITHESGGFRGWRIAEEKDLGKNKSLLLMKTACEGWFAVEVTSAAELHEIGVGDGSLRKISVDEVKRWVEDND